MNPIKSVRKSLLATTLLIATCLSSLQSHATIVQFETAFGNFEVNLYDDATPATVANFLNYVNSGAYANTIIHRSKPGFIVQGGGLTFDSQWPPSTIAANPAVVNEPTFSNIRGTIAMAKLGGNPNSATNQWFFNLTDNSQNLDLQNGGFTAFGEVMGDGMTIIDQIASIPVYNNIGAQQYNEIPLQNYAESTDPTEENLVIISSIQITDPTADTAAGLSPALSTKSSNSSGGGAILGLTCLLTLAGRRKSIRSNSQ